MSPRRIVTSSLVALPVVWTLCTIATTIWFERVFLPRIAGED